MSVSISGSAVTFNDASTQTTAATGFGFKNRIINGAMMIDQRNAGASVTPTLSNQYTLDRWFINQSASSKVSVQQNAGSVTLPTGFTNYLGITSLAATTVGAADYYQLRYKIEGYNVADLGFGTSSPSTITISFWVRSSLTGTFSFAVMNDAENRYYPTTYTINSANTWEQKTITLTGDTTGTWLKTNGGGLTLNFSLGIGSNYTTSTANAWTGANGYGISSTVNFVSTNAATLYITGVQLEKGSTATSFDYRPYSTELALCQRYYEKRNAGSAYYGVGLVGTWSSTTASTVQTTMAVPKRANPSAAFSSLGVKSGASIITITSIGGPYLSNSANGYAAGTIDLTVASGGTVGYGATVTDTGGGTGYIEFSAEL